jgi:molybdenum cofactor biosynthesis enzyme MoaA
MSWELFTRIVDQVPSIARVVLHGVGEPMLVKELPHMVRYLKAPGAYVLFNTNGTVLTPKKGRELCDTGLDELRVSLDAANARTFMLVRARITSIASCAMCARSQRCSGGMGSPCRAFRSR